MNLLSYNFSLNYDRIPKRLFRVRHSYTCIYNIIDFSLLFDTDQLKLSSILLLLLFLSLMIYRRYAIQWFGVCDWNLNCSASIFDMSGENVVGTQSMSIFNSKLAFKMNLRLAITQNWLIGFRTKVRPIFDTNNVMQSFSILIHILYSRWTTATLN